MEQAISWMLMLTLSGAAVGSFLALVSVRLPRGEGVLFGRSHCSGCSRTLAAADLVPLASFLFLRGKCRTCRAQIDRRYPLVELAGALIGAVSAFAFPGPEGLAAALLGWWLLLLGVLDLEHFWLPDRLTYPLILVGLGLAALGLGPDLADALAGAAIGFLLFAGLAAIYRRLRQREGLGGGDAKLFSAAGAWLGWQHLPSVLLLAAGGGLIAALFLRQPGVDLLRRRLPFGAFLAPAIWLVYLRVS